jgi:hypothetical protein
MKARASAWCVFRHAVFAAALASCCWGNAYAQADLPERSFAQSKAAIEQALKTMQNSTAGRLPVLAGFAASNDRPLDRFQRGYYQSKIQVSATPSGGSVVRVSVEITAWYNDPLGMHSGYQLLVSNGRLEADILDQLTDQLAKQNPPPLGKPSQSSETGDTTVAASAPLTPPVAPPENASVAGTTTPATPEASDRNEPTISAPVPRLPESNGGIPSSFVGGLADQEKKADTSTQKKVNGPDQNSLLAEAQGLEEILKNQAHPANLVAVKKSGTPVVASASLSAKALFLASAHDEFEMLDFNQDWVHVRISGLSRGWIWRNDLEMPASVPDSDSPPSPTAENAAADRFRVAREEKAIFPGDWTPLRGKTVKIVSVEKIKEDDKDTGPQLRLEFAKSLFDKNYAEIAQKSQELAGIVLIFDSADGGMIAAALPALQQWKAGKLSDAALWHECFFDPPESFTISAASGSQ